MSHRWTASDYETIARLRRKGWLNIEIANHMGLTKAAVGSACKRLVRRGVDLGPSARPTLTEDERLERSGQHSLLHLHDLQRCRSHWFTLTSAYLR